VTLGECIDDVNHATLRQTQRQLNEYFAGERRAFSLPLDFRGTDFQRRVWQALLTIPYGETRSYAHIARQIGRPTAVRAVGAANGRNPLSIVAPCHRVIGSSGQLTGFAGGLATKAQLLALEGGWAPVQQQMQLGDPLATLHAAVHSRSQGAG
jgi:methylated-DNA-[protein]-cysteine S-methyltransferase